MKLNRAIICILLTIGIFITIYALSLSTAIATTNHVSGGYKFVSDLRAGSLTNEIKSQTSCITHAFWLRYNTITDLTIQADVIVIGKISDLQVNTVPSVNAYGIDKVYTLSHLAITQILKGSLNDDIIIISQQGGTYNGITYKVSDDPIFELGDTVLLFLRKSNDGTYLTLGGPQGRYIISDGKVFSIGEIKAESMHTCDHLQTNGISIIEFISKFK